MQTVYNVLAKRSLQTAQEIIKPHDLRRSCITHMLEAGVDLSTAGRIAGHVKPDTTQRYDLRGEKAAREAADKLTLKKDAGEVTK